MSASLYRRIKALVELNHQKYTPKTAIQYLKGNTGQEVDFLSAGVLVLDVGQSVQVPGVEIKEGELSVPADEIIKNRPTLTVEQLASSEFGGCGNVVLPAAALGIRTGVMGFTGQDVEGNYFRKSMEQYGVTTSGMIVDAMHRSDVSIKIQVEDRTKREPLVFCEDAGKYFHFGSAQAKERLIALNPKSVQISYSGLFENGADCGGGDLLANDIRWIKKTLDSLVMVDTHTYAGDQKRYDCLRPSLEVADMFVCSDDEVELMIPQYKLSSGNTRAEKRQAFFNFLKDNYCKENEARFYAVTSPEEAVVLYYKPNGESVQVTVENWFTTNNGEIFTTTGAGDSWRAGLNAYILNHEQEFKSGRLNVEEAVQFANLTARLYISGSRTTAFKSYQYTDLLRLASGQKPTEDLRPLTAVYKALDRAA